MNRTLNTLVASSLVLLMVACTTNKVPEPASAPTVAPTPAPEVAQSSAVDNSAALQAQQMAEEKARTDREAAEKARAEQEAAEKAGRAAQALLSTRVFYFDYNSSDLKSEGYGSLKAHTAWLVKHPDARVRIEGNCDERGTREYNMALGERRAKAVAAYLTGNGVSERQLTVTSYGKEKPAVDGHDESAWSRNRRVELNYTAGQP
jgi:peptidoglycan-associated lipoprotein